MDLLGLTKVRKKFLNYTMKYRKNIKVSCLVYIIIALWPSYAMTQNLRIELGKAEIALNEAFSITLIAEDEKIRTAVAFPELRGFSKHGRYTESATTIDEKGKARSTESIIQTYFAKKEGTYPIESFSLQVNDRVLKAEDFVITVTAASKVNKNPLLDLEDPFFRGEEEVLEEFADVKDDVFLGVFTNKEEVYVGEEFNLTLALYVSKSTKRELQFHELSQQVAEIIKQIKPSNCWEEDFNIDRLYPVEVKINNKSYTQYKIYQASFFAFNKKPIDLPVVKLVMIDKRFAEEEADKYFLTLESNPLSISLKELPPHPLRDKIAVGRFYLDERASKQKLQTGESFTYNIALVGDGNIANISLQSPEANEAFDFYPPQIRQLVRRQNNKISGTKVFGHYVIPKNPGEYYLSDYFQFIYFNIDKERYDTLRPRIRLSVAGESLKDKSVSDFGDFYNRLLEESSQPRSLEKSRWARQSATFMLVFLVVLAFGLVLWSRRKAS
jgi:hypothetical protein